MNFIMVFMMLTIIASSHTKPFSNESEEIKSMHSFSYLDREIGHLNQKASDKMSQFLEELKKQLIELERDVPADRVNRRFVEVGELEIEDIVNSQFCKLNQNYAACMLLVLQIHCRSKYRAYVKPSLSSSSFNEFVNKSIICVEKKYTCIPDDFDNFCLVPLQLMPSNGWYNAFKKGYNTIKYIGGTPNMEKINMFVEVLQHLLWPELDIPLWLPEPIEEILEEEQDNLSELAKKLYNYFRENPFEYEKIFNLLNLSNQKINLVPYLN